MGTILHSLFYSNNPNMAILRYLCLLTILFISVILYKRFYIDSHKSEGFQLTGPYTLKQNEEIYDDFYANIYNTVRPSHNRIQYELTQICQLTQPSQKYSVFLEIGSGTGALVNELHNAGFYAYGIDRSQSMIDYSERLYEDIQVTCGSVDDSMAYESNTFTHILCMDHTIYSFADKELLLKNAYFWLKYYGYLIMHLVDDLAIGKKVTESKGNGSKGNGSNISYQSSYQHMKNDHHLLFKESFTDIHTNQVRQHEHTLYVESTESILAMARNIGFDVYGLIDYNDLPGQHLYIMVKV